MLLVGDGIVTVVTFLLHFFAFTALPLSGDGIISSSYFYFFLFFFYPNIIMSEADEDNDNHHNVNQAFLQSN